MAIWEFDSEKSFLTAVRHPEGSSLDLPAVLWWQGGLSLKRAKAKLATLLRVQELPRYNIIHCGGNDLGHIPLKQLRIIIRKLLILIRHNFPDGRVVWSVLSRDWGRDMYSLERLRRETGISQRGVYLRNHFHMIFSFLTGFICQK